MLKKYNFLLEDFKLFSVKIYMNVMMSAQSERLVVEVLFSTKLINIFMNLSETKHEKVNNQTRKPVTMGMLIYLHFRKYMRDVN